MPSRSTWYMDEHVPPAVTEGLRRRGIDVMTIQQMGTMGTPDAIHLILAQESGRTIFTQDDDFLRLAASNTAHQGIVYAPQATPVGSIIRGLLLIDEVYTAEEMIGRVEFV